MSKRGKIYIILVALTVLIIITLEVNKPKAINWFPSYSTHHKIPFGSYVFDQQLQRLSDSITYVNQPPFEYLKKNSISGTYLFYNNDINFGNNELFKLLDWVYNGNTLVVSAMDFEEKLLDTLNLYTKSVNIFNNLNNKYKVRLVNPNLTAKSYTYDREETFYHFSKIDTTNTTVIGLIDKYREDNETFKDSLINNIRQPYGDGEIILSTFPQAFTNYFILKSPNQNYTADILSYLDTKRPIYIDKYYKSGKTFYTSPMYLFLSQTSLKWAYYALLIGVLIYIIFEGKRKQRAIPIIKPLKNQTVDFTRTIANMYYENNKHKDIADHKTQHFLNYIRANLYINTSEIDDKFIKDLTARSNNTEEDTKKIFKFIDNLSKKRNVNKIELEQLNTLIEQFKSKNQ